MSVRLDICITARGAAQAALARIIAKSGDYTADMAAYREASAVVEQTYARLSEDERAQYAEYWCRPSEDIAPPPDRDHVDATEGSER